MRFFFNTDWSDWTTPVIGFQRESREFYTQLYFSVGPWTGGVYWPNDD